MNSTYPASEGDTASEIPRRSRLEAFEDFCWWALKYGAAVFGFVVLGLIACAVALADEPPAFAQHALPPTYLSAIVTYDAHGRFVTLVTGSTRFTSCRDALDDTQSALAKHAEYAPKGSRAEGACIPLHTYSAEDLVQ